MIELHVEPRCHTCAHFEVGVSERGMLYAEDRIVEHNVVITCAHKSLCDILRKEAKEEIMRTVRELAGEDR